MQSRNVRCHAERESPGELGDPLAGYAPRPKDLFPGARPLVNHEMVRLMMVEPLTPPEVPVIVTLYVPTLALLFTFKVSVLLVAAGLGENDADAPCGKPAAERVTLPLNPPASAMLIVSVPLLPR